MGCFNRTIVVLESFVDLRGLRVLELGQQEFMPSWKGHTNCKEYYKSIGVQEYASIYAEPTDYIGLFEVVTNLGETEHASVESQEPLFRLIHHLCRTGGYMLHDSPVSCENHAPISYSRLFFFELAYACHYDIVYMDPPENMVYGHLLTLYRKNRESTFNVPDYIWKSITYDGKTI